MRNALWISHSVIRAISKRGPTVDSTPSQFEKRLSHNGIMVSAIEMNNPLRDSFQRDNFSYFFFPQWYLELLRFIAHLVALFGDATSLFSSSNDILSNGLARWWFELSVMAPAIETNNQVHHQRGNLTCFYILQSIFRGIEINKPLSLEILCFLDDILSDEFARCWFELSVMESSGEVKKPLSLSSFVTFFCRWDG